MNVGNNTWTQNFYSVVVMGGGFAIWASATFQVDSISWSHGHVIRHAMCAKVDWICVDFTTSMFGYILACEVGHI